MINLFDFTYCGDYNRQIQNLARMVPEKWSFSDTEDNGILKGYLEHTFKRLYEDEKMDIFPTREEKREIDKYKRFDQELRAFVKKNHKPEIKRDNNKKIYDVENVRFFRTFFCK